MKGETKRATTPEASSTSAQIRYRARRDKRNKIMSASFEEGRRLEAMTGGSLDPVETWVRSKRGSDAGSVFEIDVDRLGVIALDATSRLLEMLPLKTPDAQKSEKHRPAHKTHNKDGSL